jgi:hypothetical protein
MEWGTIEHLKEQLDWHRDRECHDCEMLAYDMKELIFLLEQAGIIRPTSD